MTRLQDIKNELLKQGLPSERFTPGTARILAEQIARTTEPFKGGQCHACGKVEDRVVPRMLEVCDKDAQKFAMRSGLKIIRKQVVFGAVIDRLGNKVYRGHQCDWCRGQSKTKNVINPSLCEACSRRILRRHRA